MGLCFSYLSKPITDKESTDESSDKLDCGASSMQGWRNTQEDAHNCILDYDSEASFFAVYDGHGGHEVAQYCSQELPNFIKNTPEYKEGKVEEALVSGFLQFDALIATPEVVTVLKKIAAEKTEVEESDDDDDEEEENVNNLYEEAAMPIEEVIKKYTSNLEKSDKTEKSISKTKKDDEVASSSASASCSSSQVDKQQDPESTSNEAAADEPREEVNGPEKVPEAENEPTSSDSKVPEPTQSGDKEEESQVQNGEIPAPSSEAEAKSDVSSTSAPVENGTPSKKGKGKAVIKPEAVKTPVNTRPKRNAQQLYKEWLDMGEDSDDSDEEDQTFEGPIEETSDEEGEGVNVSVDASEEESSEDGEEEEEEEKDADEDDDADDDDKEDPGLAFARNMKEGPGSDSGCTAVVALLKGNELYVANAGDSRCVVCRNGKAVAMSFDHQPRYKPEFQRIVKAGGEITYDGRVNGGLNLSRAIGDHAYKQNKELSDREQMITALPDVKKMTINPGEDEFMILACDGIWNSMNRQEVVDFVKKRISEGREKMSQICEEMFDHCLSPSMLDDSAGCDNMTAIIIRFKTASSKRAASPLLSEETETKRAKTETDSEAQGSTV